jgi:hypothetical protein
LPSAGFLLGLLFSPEDSYVPPKHWAFSKPYNIITQKTVLFIVIAARTSNPTTSWPSPAQSFLDNSSQQFKAFQRCKMPWKLKKKSMSGACYVQIPCFVVNLQHISCRGNLASDERRLCTMRLGRKMMRTILAFDWQG